MSKRPHDEQDWAEALEIIRERFPEARRIQLETSDQQRCGFVLVDVEMADFSELSVADPKAFDELSDDIWHLISSLGWDSVVGEDKYGYATVEL